MIRTIENKLFIFKLAREDQTSKHKYVLELAKDILKLVKKLEDSGNIHRLSMHCIELIQEVKNFVLEDEIEQKRKELLKIA